MNPFLIRTALASILAAAFSCVPVGAWAAKLEVDPALKPHEKVSGISGTLNSVGSDTMNNLMTYWAEGFARFYPGVKVQVEGKGSNTAPPALIAGTAQLGPMSRPMKDSEIDQFEKQIGYPPTCLRTALDSLAVYVHKDNPIESLSLPQVDAIFSKTRLMGGTEPIDRWGQLGLTGEWELRPISLYGRNSASGTYGFFKEHALGNGDFKDQVKEQPGSASVVQGITEDRMGPFLRLHTRGPARGGSCRSARGGRLARADGLATRRSRSCIPHSAHRARARRRD